MSLPTTAILEFWFGAASPTAAVAAASTARWFRPDPAFDDEIRARFGALLEAPSAVANAVTDAPSALAAILVLDQFPRNAFRGQARAFATDSLALQLAARACQEGQDDDMGLHQRLFLYLPFQHAEDLASQERALALYARLADDAPPGLADFATSLVAYARKHHDIIARFGRFPGRNMALGRSDTAAEAAWIAAGGDTFGQR